MGKLDGKVAVITGATSGMALATAKLFVAEGAQVVITGRRKDVLDEAVAAIGGDVTGVQGDAGDLADLDRLVELASAGTGNPAEPLPAVTPESFDATFAVNARGTLFLVQRLLPLLSTGASVILNSTVSASKGMPGTTVYAASKAALRAYARVWTAELADRDIRVNLISPGPIDTSVELPDGLIERIVEQVPAGRRGEPSEIATAALFLASSDSTFVRGTELFVDGGVAQV
jgi:NAD(P)-dependent dehydrogenase (short-subunit alcohol dehydrogenase family)